MTLQERYEDAKKQYAAIGVNTDEAIERLMEAPVSLHCWQGDDVTGFDHDGPLTGALFHFLVIKGKVLRGVSGIHAKRLF